MILDKQLMFSEAQDLAQVAASYLSTNTVDLGAVGTPVLGGTIPADIGRGMPPEVVANITETFAGAGATLDIQLVMADNAALSSNLTVIDSTGVLVLATLVAGYRAKLKVPRGITKRYLGMRYIIGTATTTAGKITAGLAIDQQTNPTA